MIEEARCVVFSRDRALQLDAFLTSVAAHASSVYRNVLVLFRATGIEFRAAYARLQREHGNVTWLEERSFRDDVLDAVASVGSHLVFHTDDDVFFADVAPFELRDDEVCFTLRLGLNTTYCYPLDVVEQLDGAEFEHDRVSWSWRDQRPGAYSYPLALNGHVFRSDEAREWLARVEYTNPNELEAALQPLAAEVRPQMASFCHSRVLSIPANIVNETFPNRHAATHDTAALNERFLSGERLDLTAMDFSAVTACHQEVDFVFGSVS